MAVSAAGLNSAQPRSLPERCQATLPVVLMTDFSQHRQTTVGTIRSQGGTDSARDEPSPKDMVAAVPKSGIPERSAVPAPGASDPGGVPVDGAGSAAQRQMPPRVQGGRAVKRRLLAATGIALAVALLFFAYLRVSRTYPENSDEANILLMSWDMLHGNMLLHGWYLSDVSFYTTELPQYAMLERLLGLHADTAHVAAAMTYTFAVLLAALLARGRAVGRAAWPRMLLAAGIMVAPQLGVGVFVLLLSVGHIGTAVPLMLIWLIIDLAGPVSGERGGGQLSPGGERRGGQPPRERGGSGRGRPPRGYAVPAAVGLLLTWVLVADPLALVVGIIPLVTVCAARVIRATRAGRHRDDGSPRWLAAGLRARWYEISLAIAAILAWGLASLVNRLLRGKGAFILHPLAYQLAPVHTWPKHAWVTGQGLLALFGAKPQAPAAEMAFALLHLAGVALVAWAMWRVARQFFSWPDMVSQILLVAIVLNVAVYVPSTLANATDLNAREFAVVLPFGAVLAGRTLAASLRGAEASWLRGPSWRLGLASALLAGYAASLGYAAAQPSVPPANEQLAAFLAAHHLTEGLSGYWQSSIVTVGSDGAVTVRAVQPGTLQPYLWESKGSWYDPGLHRATFVVTDSQPGFFNHWEPSAAALAPYGPPAHTYRIGPYTVLVWDQNLLARPR